MNSGFQRYRCGLDLGTKNSKIYWKYVSVSSGGACKGLSLFQILDFMKNFFKLKPNFRGVIVRDLNWSASGFILRISEGSAEEAFPDFLVLILEILWRLEKVEIFLMKNSYTCSRSY